MLDDEITETQALIQLAHHNQAIIGGDPRSLKIDLQRGVERKLKRPVLFLTFWVSSFGGFSLRSNPYE